LRKDNLDFSLTAETAKTAEMRKIIFLYCETCLTTFKISYTKALFVPGDIFQKVTQAHCHGQQGSESGVGFLYNKKLCDLSVLGGEKYGLTIEIG